MKILVISDLHIGDPRVSCEQEIISMLRYHTYDKLVINGDLIDYWSGSSYKDIKDNSLIKELQKIATQKTVFWVSGNHDHAADPNLIPKATKVESYTSEDNGHKTMFIHGHQAFWEVNNESYERPANKANLWAVRHLGVDIQQWFRETLLNKLFVKMMWNRLIYRFGSLADTIIVGHSHVSGMWYNNDKYLYDVGSTTFTNTYAIISNGRVHLLKM